MTGAELRERMTLRWECYCDLHPRLTWREESEWWISALAGELGIRRDGVYILQLAANAHALKAMMEDSDNTVEEIAIRAAADALTTLLDAAEGK
jgi:hypothetical protein